MTRKYILKDGKPVPCPDLLAWGRWMEENANERVLRRTEVHTPGGPVVVVSTVFLGLDHGFGGGKPVLWETMIFGGPHSEWMCRYHTRAEALDGHGVAVASLRMPAGTMP